MKAFFNVQNAFAALVVVSLLLLPLYSSLTGNIFILTLFTRIVILALAAVSLNLVLGYGGMPSFGHAAYFGIGGYAGGVLGPGGGRSGFVQVFGALGPAAPFTLGIGALSPRTPGGYFIMITLALPPIAYL